MTLINMRLRCVVRRQSKTLGIGKCVQNIKRRSIMAEDDDSVHDEAFQGLGFNFDFVTAQLLNLRRRPLCNSLLKPLFLPSL